MFDVVIVLYPHDIDYFQYINSTEGIVTEDRQKETRQKETVQKETRQKETGQKVLLVGQKVFILKKFLLTT